MRTFEVREPPPGQLPRRPAALKKFDAMGATHGPELAERIEGGATVVVAGLSLMGAEGYMVSTIGIMKADLSKPEAPSIKGWSLHLGHPDEKFRKFRHFDLARSREDVCLPLPTVMVYFACETDAALVEECADDAVLTQIAHFVVPFISDEGPPKGIDW